MPTFIDRTGQRFVKLLALIVVACSIVLGQTTTYISDMTFVSSTNGWGPVERDKSNGETGAGDGGTISLGGTTFSKGLGVHSISSVVVHLNRNYRRFQASIGVDDNIVGTGGSVIFTVTGDGVQLYQSATLNASSATIALDLSVIGVHQLTLAVGDSGDGSGSDWSDWADAKVVGFVPVAYKWASDFAFANQSNGWGPVEKDLSNGENGLGDGIPISLDGTTYTKGIGMHATASIDIDLDRLYRRFTSVVGVDDEAALSSTMIFSVYGDGVLLATSPVMVPTSVNHHFDVSVERVKTLTLSVADAGDGNGSDHGSWGHPLLKPYGKLGTSRTSLLASRHRGRLKSVFTGDGAGPDPPGDDGTPQYFRIVDPSDDWWLITQWDSNATVRNWANAHINVLEGHGNWGGIANPLFVNGPKVMYLDAYAIYNPGYPNSAQPPGENDSLVLRDSAGNRTYVDYACNASFCAQYAADIGNPAWRTWFINVATSGINSYGYTGLFVDDVNMDIQKVRYFGGPPIDPRTGIAMTNANWRRYMAEFMEEVRAAFPTLYIMHNPVYYMGGLEPGWPGADPYITRQTDAADSQSSEAAFYTNTDVVGGDWVYSLQKYMEWVDFSQSRGAGVAHVEYCNDDDCRDFVLAVYYLTMDSYNSGDYIADKHNDPPGTNGQGVVLADTWWPGYDTACGAPTNARSEVLTGLWRRDFANCIILLNEDRSAGSGSTPRTVSLGGTYIRVSTGASVTSVTLGTRKAAVLKLP